MNKHSGPDNFASDGTGLFFFATDSFCGRELYYFDGTTTPVNLTDITAGPQGSVSGTNIQVALFADNIFFSANTAAAGIEPWIYNRVNKTVRLLQDLNPGSAMSQPACFTPFNGKVYFRARTAGYGDELWVYDPAPDTCIMLSDISPGALNSSPDYLTVFNNKLYFTAVDTGTGSELFEYNPVDGKVKLVVDIEPGKPASAPCSLTVMGNKLYFWATTMTHGKELHAYNGSAVTMLADLGAGTAWGNGYQHMAGYKGSLYFAGYNTTKKKPDVYKYDPGTNQATVAFNLHATIGADPSSFAVYKDKLYFNANDGIFGNEMWQYDGATPPKRITDIMPGAGHTDFDYILATNNGLYFSANSPVIGKELYRYIDTTTPAAAILNVVFNADVKIYPNPTQDIAHLQLKLSNAQALNVSITDVNGRIVFTKEPTIYSAAKHTIDIPMHNLPQGNYVYRIDDADGKLMASGKLQKL